MIDISLIETATVADLRNHFRRVSAWIDDGRSVEITRRGRPFARLTPVAEASKRKLDQPDFKAQRQEIWGDRVFSAGAVEAMEAFEREGDEG